MFYRKIVKRCFDFLLSFIAILFLSPLFLIISLVVLLDDGAPIIYSQKRLGYKGKQFVIFKFRTMIKNADKKGPLHTDPQDKRVTKSGKFLRKYSLDELPQLFNIFKGEMSIVGNRPDIYKDYELLDNLQKKRLELKPGLTGWAAVNGRSSLTAEQRLKYDLEYIDKCSLWFDVKIILKTVIVVLRHVGINSELKK